MKKWLTSISLLILLSALSACTEKPVPVSEPEVPQLVLAAEIGDLPQLEQLIGETNNVDVRDSCKWTPLMKAAQNGHLETVERLLMAGASPTLGDKGGYTALMLAASENHVEIVRLLLEFGADINHREKTRGWSALMWAAQRGHRESVELLLAHGAEHRFLDKQGNSAHDWATKEHHPEIAQLLVI